MSKTFRADRVELEQRQWNQMKRAGLPVYQHAHKLVAETAKSIAACFYEDAAHDNMFYNFYPNQKFFVRREWHLFIGQARACLAQQLNDPKIPQSGKDAIFEALTLDRGIPRPDNAGRLN